MNLELTDLAKITIYQTLGFFIPLPSQSWDYRRVVPCPAFLHKCWRSRFTQPHSCTASTLLTEPTPQPWTEDHGKEQGGLGQGPARAERLQGRWRLKSGRASKAVRADGTAVALVCPECESLSPPKPHSPSTSESKSCLTFTRRDTSSLTDPGLAAQS